MIGLCSELSNSRDCEETLRAFRLESDLVGRTNLAMAFIKTSEITGKLNPQFTNVSDHFIYSFVNEQF